jgi:hypothetical protein
MINAGIADHADVQPELKGTLWRCEKCLAFISIHSVIRVDEALCPSCMDIPLEFCGMFDSILGRQFTDC